MKHNKEYIHNHYASVANEAYVQHVQTKKHTGSQYIYTLALETSIFSFQSYALVMKLF